MVDGVQIPAEGEFLDLKAIVAEAIDAEAIGETERDCRGLLYAIGDSEKYSQNPSQLYGQIVGEAAQALAFDLLFHSQVNRLGNLVLPLTDEQKVKVPISIDGARRFLRLSIENLALRLDPEKYKDQGEALSVDATKLAQVIEDRLVKGLGIAPDGPATTAGR